MIKKCFVITILILTLCLLCSACAFGAGQPTEPPVCYKATYMLGGVVYAEQQVEAGATAKAMEVKVPGVRFAGWTDAAGNAVEPDKVPLQSSVTYIAVVYPELSQHKSFLFPDEHGFLWPTAPITSSQLRQALEVLAADGAKAYFPTLLDGAEPMDAQQLKTNLSSFFETAKVEAALPQAEGPVTRGDFAVAMCTLLGRDGSEMVVLSPDSKVPLDMNAKMEHYQALLEASVEHTVNPAGISWENVELPTGMEPGFLNLDGYLYYVQEDGFLLRDGDVGKLHFGQDGRYTSGDAELDKTVAEILNPILAENAGAERVELLRHAFDYCVNEYVYLRKNPYAKGETGWEINDAKKMAETGKGNCYGFAGIFWALARGLGYEATAVSGTCTSTDQPHAWVVIAFDGENYFFDPQWKNAYNERKVYDKDMFMIPMDKVYWWGYEWVKGSF